MTFLEPMTGLLAAAVCLPALLLLYFLKLRRRPLRVSSTMYWQEAARDMQANVPFRWLRFNWLLLLQLLALACLLIAAARPLLPGGGFTGKRLVLLIDTSASMGALDGDRAIAATGTSPASRLDEAKGRAREMIEALSRDAGSQRIMLARFASDAVTLTSLTDDSQTLREALNKVMQTDQVGDPLAAIRLIRAVLDRPEDEANEQLSRPSVLLLTSGAAPQYEETAAHARQVAAALAGLDVKILRCGPASAAASSNNTGIVSINARRDFDDPSTIRVFARVVSAADKPSSAQIVLSFNGVERERRVISLAPAPAADSSASTNNADRANSAEQPQPSTTPPEASVGFSLTETGSGVIMLRLIDDDILRSDDSAAVVIDSLAPPRIALVAPAGPDGKPAPDRFLLAALDVLRPGLLQVIDPTEAAARTLVPDAATPGDRGKAGFAGIDLLIYDRVNPIRVPALPTLHFAASLPSSRPLNEAPTATIEPQPSTTKPDETERFLSWERDHPLLRYASLETIIMSPPSVLRLPPDDRSSAAGFSTKVLATTPRGPVIALVRDTSGRAAVDRLLIAFELSSSNWGPHYSFPLILSNAVDVLTRRAEGRSGRGATTRDPVTVESLPGSREIELTGLSATVRYPVALSADAQEQRVTLGIIERAGLYRLTSVPARDSVLAVNLASEHETLLRTGTELRLAHEMPPSSPLSNAQQTPSGREVWHWFVIAAIAILTIEWVLYAWLMKS